MADLSVIYRIAADITGLQDGVNRAATAAEGLGTTAKRVGGVLSAAFTGLQIKQAASDVVTYASHLSDLAAKSGISAEAVQKLDFVAKQSGSSFDQISQALAMMGNKLVDGSDSTVNALATLGLNFDTIRKMSPDQAFQAIGEAIGKIPDPMQRSNLAMELFGKSGATLLPTLTSDIGGLQRKAEELGLVMSNDVVNAGDDLDDKFAELEQRVNTVKGNALTPLMNYFLAMPSWLQTGMAGVNEFGGALSGIGTTIMMAGGPVAILGTLKTALMGLAGLLTLPAGLVVAAVVGLVAIWYKWDEIKVIAQNVYTAIKTWLVDKFNAVVESIKAKVDAVTGFFKGMYDKVVGQSYVPDMIARIGAEFGALNTKMVTPTKLATDAITGYFQSMANKVIGMIGGPNSSFGKLMSSGLGALFAGPLGAVVSQGVNFLVGLAWKGVQKIGGWFMGLFTRQPNDERDAFFNQFGGLEGVNEAAQAAGDTDLSTTRAIFGAKTKGELDSAIQAWMDRTGRTSIPHLAAGGLVRQPTLAMVGEGGPELVTPLSRLGEFGTRPIVVQLSIDGRRFMEATAKHLPRTVEQWVGA